MEKTLEFERTLRRLVSNFALASAIYVTSLGILNPILIFVGFSTASFLVIGIARGARELFLENK